MSASRIILVTGLPGTGKTTVARQLASRYGVPLIAKDLIKEPLLSTLGASDSAQSRRLSDASFAVLFALARELHAAGSALLLEGNFRPGEHEQPLRGAFPSTFGAHAATNFCQVLCRVEEQERVSRLLRRQSDPARHAGHRDSDLALRAPAARVDAFLDLPGDRFVHAGADDRNVLAALDAWWNSRTV